MRGQRFAVEIPPMPVMVDVGPGRGRGYVQITDHYPEPGQLVMGAALDARRQAAVSAAFDDLAQNPDHSTVGWWLYTAFPISHVGEGHRAQLCGNYADAIDQLGEILRREPLSYWAVLELGGGGPEVRRDQVLASGQATVGTTYLVRDTGRGRRFQPLVGFELPGTSYANVDQLNTQIVAFARAIVAATGADSRLVPASSSAADVKAMHDQLAGYPGGGQNAAVVDGHDKIKAAGALGAFWYDEVAPFLTEWQGFEQKHSHWYDVTTQLATGSEVYQSWQSRLNALRKKAVALGVKPPSDQTDIPRPPGMFAELGDLGKKLLIGASVIGGIVIVAEVVKR